MAASGSSRDSGSIFGIIRVIVRVNTPAPRYILIKWLILSRVNPVQALLAAARPGHNPSICSGYRAENSRAPVFCRFLPGIDPRSTKISPVKIKIFFGDPVITRTIVRFRPGACPVSTRYRSGSGRRDRDIGVGVRDICIYLPIYIYFTPGCSPVRTRKTRTILILAGV